KNRSFRIIRSGILLLWHRAFHNTHCFKLEQNVTLPCYINSSSEMAWYRLSSEKIALLISAARGNLKKKDFITYHNEDQSHFRLEADRRLDSVSLAITGVRESDLGLYYCALGISAKTMHFGTAVRLTFAGYLLCLINSREFPISMHATSTIQSAVPFSGYKEQVKYTESVCLSLSFILCVCVCVCVCRKPIKNSKALIQ
uniref:Immunoglobulin domain-containing protein n=1 Tax=Sinocyclocheilus rhinocerous TaxID=307959 RepID=A0A673IG17_9TELE